MLDAPQSLPGTLVDAVMAHIISRIADRRLVSGARLASIRAVAGTMGVSKSTVVEAFQRLVAEGFVTSRPGSGFYVADALVPRSVKPISPMLDRAIDPFWLPFQSLDAAPGSLMPGAGVLPADWMPRQAIQKAIREVARSPAKEQLDYDTPQGYAPLRDLTARRLAERGIAVPASQILLTDSGSLSGDLVCRLLIEPGDTVLIDDPCYFNFHALLALHKVKVVSVPYTATGPDLDAFSAALAQHKPRLYLTNSGCHNPTSAILSHATAHRLLQLAEAHDLLIVEDEVFADLEHEPAPRLAALDGLQRVITIGSYSKTISAATRCGFVAARSDWIDLLVNLKLASQIGNSRLAATIVHRVLIDGSYRRHVEALRTKLAAAMTATLGRLRAVGLEPWLEPRAGMFVWARLPAGLDAGVVARHALGEGIVLAPGTIFSTSPAAASFLRFNVARCAEPRIFEVLEAAIGGAESQSR